VLPEGALNRPAPSRLRSIEPAGIPQVAVNGPEEREWKGPSPLVLSCVGSQIIARNVGGRERAESGGYLRQGPPRSVTSSESDSDPVVESATELWL
jgi:hypothetical protein